MPNPRQRNIPATLVKYERFKYDKEQYEHYIGRSVTWAAFLNHVIPLGLAQLGVYDLPEKVESKDKALWITCSHCHHRFPVVVVEPEPPAAVIPCDCGTQLVIDILKHSTNNEGG